LNDFVHEVAQELDKRGYVVGKFKPLSHAAVWEMPVKPPDIDTNPDSRQEYKRAATAAHDARKDYIRSMHVRTSITLNMAEMFKSRTFYIPWSFDYRGRVYPIPPFLSPQDTDFGKAMLRFAEEAFVTPESEEWIAFQVATTYGLDKETIHNRLAWVANNKDLISRVATDPLRYISDWEGVEEPWQFLSACHEYHHCIITCDRNTTGLPIAVDATCSGLQILAGLCRDARTASLVNVLPGNEPQDAYKTVAEACIHKFPERLREHVDRTVTKRCVMTIPYNAKPWSNRQYIKDAFKKKGITDLTKEELTDCTNAVRYGVKKVAPSALKAMDWISKEMGNAIKRGESVIQWTTPSGFVVYQKRDKYTMQRLDLKLLGRCAFSILGAEKGPDINKHKSSGSPNLIHSIDASLLHLAGLQFNAPLSVIHDSVLCRATDMSTLSSIVRETYMHIFAEQEFLRDFAKQIGAESEPPIIGDLEPSSVIESTYFFC
jgi:DNA-directed RNA polymerase